jgi:hypothetical protein
MQSVTSATAVATTARANRITLFASLELNKSKWVVTINSPGGEKFSKPVVEDGDGAGLLDLLSRSRAKARAALRRADQSDRHSGSGIGRVLDSSLASCQRDGEPRRRRGFNRGRSAASAGQDRCDRRRDAVADADGLGSRRARKRRIAGG